MSFGVGHKEIVYGLVFLIIFIGIFSIVCLDFFTEQKEKRRHTEEDAKSKQFLEKKQIEEEAKRKQQVYEANQQVIRQRLLSFVADSTTLFQNLPPIY